LGWVEEISLKLRIQSPHDAHPDVAILPRLAGAPVARPGADKRLPYSLIGDRSTNSDYARTGLHPHHREDHGITIDFCYERTEDANRRKTLAEYKLLIILPHGMNCRRTYPTKNA